MAHFKLLPIPAEDYDALGLTENTILETRITDDGALVIRKVTGEDMEEFACDADCDSCPVAETDCDGECLSCPCYACCDDSDYQRPEVNAFKEGVCKSSGVRRDSE